MVRVASAATPSPVEASSGGREEDALGGFERSSGGSKSSMGVGDGVVAMTDAQRRALVRSPAPKEYNPVRTAAYYRKRPVEQLVRVLQIGTSLGGFIVDVIFDVQSGKFESNAKLRSAQLREKLTLLGPAFVKVGQALSTRPDLLPAQ